MRLKQYGTFHAAEQVFCPADQRLQFLRVASIVIDKDPSGFFDDMLEPSFDALEGFDGCPDPVVLNSQAMGHPNSGSSILHVMPASHIQHHPVEDPVFSLHPEGIVALTDRDRRSEDVWRQASLPAAGSRI